MSASFPVSYEDVSFFGPGRVYFDALCNPIVAPDRVPEEFWKKHIMESCTMGQFEKLRGLELTGHLIRNVQIVGHENTSELPVPVLILPLE